MIAFFARLFGYVLNFLYEFVNNFGLAIILFSILVKLIMLPMSIKQQKTMKKTQKINDEMKQIQFKYKNDPEKLNQEIMSLYKRENMSPFSGCLSSILQIILLFAVFYLVRSPLTYMRKIDTGVIEKLQEQVVAEGRETAYNEIAIIDYINRVRQGEETKPEEETQPEQEANIVTENVESIESAESTEEVQNIEEQENQVNEEQGENTENGENNEEEPFNVNDYIDTAYINMEFLGLDLGKVPTEDLTNIKTLIIPALYVITSIISIRMSTNMTKKKKDDKSDEKEEYDPMAEANKTMGWFMPIMSISIALVAPLGLALYWLVNNILMMIERLILNKVIKDEEEEAIRNA